MKHSPKPWQLLKSNNENYFIIGADSTEEVCANVHFTLEIALVVKNHGQPNLANAQLITAAPELLEALQFALDRLKIVEKESDYDHRTFHQGIAIDKAIAAINKATGKKK